jgi:protein-tyrosine phosphatase
LKITHIINITQHIGNKFEDKGIKYLNVSIDDTEKFKISNFFRQTYEFIEQAFTNDNSELSEGFSTCTSLDALCQQDSNETHEIENFDLNLKESRNENFKTYYDSCLDIAEKNEIIQKYFKQEYKKYKSNSKILIHCSMGVSRSPSMAMMYLMKKFNICMCDAFDLVQLQRQKSQPIDSFLTELEEFEKQGYIFTESYC